MPLLAFLAPLVEWIFRGVVIKFVVFTALFGVLALLLPIVSSWLAPYISTSGLSSAFGGVDGGVWFWLDFFALDYGVPALLSAYITRFLIRRLPIIG